MFKTVLLPIDLNHPASWEKALPMARGLAGPDGAVHVLGIVHDIGSAMVAAVLPPDFERQALDRMEADLEAFIAGQPSEGAALHPKVGHGHVPETILAAAAGVNADLIVMASHPPSDLRILLVGSNADKVVRHAEIPVLVVR